VGVLDDGLGGVWLWWGWFEGQIIGLNVEWEKEDGGLVGDMVEEAGLDGFSVRGSEV